MQEQGVVDDDLMLRTELKTQASVVIAAANAIYLGLPQLKVFSHSCVEVSCDEEFVFGVNLLQEAVQVTLEGLLTH